jgi:hypothetical protein
MKDESLNNTLRAIFRRRGLETDYTKIFDAWPDLVQERISKVFTLQAEELPVLAFVPSEEHWLLITTRHIVQYKFEKLQEIDCSLLKKVGPALLADAAAGAVDPSEMKHLRLTLADRNEMIIEVEPGRPYNGIWNLLLHFTVLNAEKSI